MKKRAVATVMLCGVLFCTWITPAYGRGVMDLFSSTIKQMGRQLALPVVKTATPTEHPNEYQISVAGRLPQNQEEAKAVVFVLDISQKSQDAGTLEAHKQLLLELSPELFTGQSSSRFGLVTVGERVTSYGWISQLEEFQQILHQIQPEAGLYLDEGLLQGEELAASYPEGEPHLILLASGYATYSNRIASFSSQVECEEGHRQRWTVTPTYYQPKEKHGGSTSPYVISSRQVFVPAARCQLGTLHNSSGKLPKTHGEAAVFQSQQLNQEGVSVVSLSLGGAPEIFGFETMSALSANFFVEKEESLAYLVQEFSPPPSTKITVTETFEDPVRLHEESLHVSTGEVRVEEGRIIWEFEESGTLSYLVSFQVEQPEFIKGRSYPLGKESTFQIDDGEEHYPLVQPTGVGTYSQIYLMGVRVNEHGFWLNEEEELVDTEQRAMVVANKTPWLNSYGVNQWDPTATVTVSQEILEAPPNYQLFQPQSTQRRVDLTYHGETATICFDYQKNVGHCYKIEHVIDGESTPFYTEMVFEVPHQTVITQVEDRSDQIGGTTLYVLDHVAGLPATIVDDETVLSVIYKEYQPSVYQYREKYYQNGELVETSILYQQEERRLQIPEESQRYPEYQLHEISYQGNTYQSGDWIELEENTVQEIHFYYREVEELLVYHYQIKYYLDGTPQDLFTISGSVLDTSPFISLEHPSFSYRELTKVVVGGEERGTELPNEVEILYNNYTVELYYESQREPEEDLFIGFHYYYNGYENPFDQREYLIPSGTTLTVEDLVHSEESMQAMDQYQRVGTVPDLPVVLTENTQVFIYYESLPGVEQDYFLNVYVDHQFVTRIQGSVEPSQLLTQQEMVHLVQPETNWRLEEIQLVNCEGDLVEVESSFLITHWQKELILSFHTAEEEESYTYQVEHYLDGILAPEYTWQEETTQPLLSEIPIQELEGYRWVSTVPSLPYSIEDGDVFRVYYESETVLPPPKDSPPASVLIHFLYTTENGEEIQWEKQQELTTDDWIHLWSYFRTTSYEEKPLQLKSIRVEESWEIEEEKRISLGASNVGLGASGGELFGTTQQEPESQKETREFFLGPFDYLLLSPECSYTFYLEYTKTPENGKVIGTREPSKTSGGTTKQRSDPNSPLLKTSKTQVQNVEEILYQQAAAKGSQHLAPARTLPLTGGLESLSLFLAFPFLLAVVGGSWIYFVKQSSNCTKTVTCDGKKEKEKG